MDLWLSLCKQQLDNLFFWFIVSSLISPQNTFVVKKKLRPRNYKYL